MKCYRIAIYIRLSMEDLDLCGSEEKEESFSVNNQRSYIRNYLNQREQFKDAIIKEFVDDGYSGTNFDRPGVQKMLFMCRQNELDCIVVKDLSRFGRNYLEVGNYLEQIFPFLGIRFIGINDDYDSNNYAGQTSGMDIAFKNFIYEMYSRDLSEKVKSGVAVCMKRGEYHAGCTVYGYKKLSDGKRIVIDYEAAEIIRRVFREIAAGIDAKTVAKKLNEDGVPTRLSYKQSKGEQINRHYKENIWDRNKIHSIIHNEVYQGDQIYRKSVRPQMGKKQKINQPKESWEVIPNHHEAIVSRALFQKANESIRKAKTAEYDRSNVSRGIIFCGCCGKRLELHKTKNPYYQCKRKDLLEETDCNHIRIEKRTIEKAIMEIWKKHCEIFHTESPAILFAKQLKQLLKRERELQQQLEHLPAEKMNLYEKFREGEIKKEVFLREKDWIDQRIREVQGEMGRLAKRVEQHGEKIRNCGDMENFIEKYCEVEEEPDEFMREMVEKVVVYKEGRVEIEWRYKDEFVKCEK